LTGGRNPWLGRMLEIWLLLVASGPQFAHALTAEAATRVRGDISRAGRDICGGCAVVRISHCRREDRGRGSTGGTGAPFFKLQGMAEITDNALVMRLKLTMLPE